MLAVKGRRMRESQQEALRRSLTCPKPYRCASSRCDSDGECRIDVSWDVSANGVTCTHPYGYGAAPSWTRPGVLEAPRLLIPWCYDI